MLRDGEVLARHAWGWANAERRIAFTPQTLFRMCSITKQFTCALLLDAFPDPSVLDADVRVRLPLMEGASPGALHLCHNQSGLRDYWAVEDEAGRRYWLFRRGDGADPATGDLGWFLHGLF